MIDKIIGFIGAGNMGSAMIGGIVHSELVTTSQIIASAHSADRTYPILRKIFKSCAWIDTVVRISISRIIYVSTWLTNVFLHNSHLFLLLIPYFTRYVTILQPVQINIWGLNGCLRPAK